MGRTDERTGTDRDPGRERCDVCGHDHACYVGGRPTYGTAGQVVLWERRVCLGCLMRAVTPGGFESCAACRTVATPRQDRRSRHA